MVQRTDAGNINTKLQGDADDFQSHNGFSDCVFETQHLHHKLISKNQNFVSIAMESSLGMIVNLNKFIQHIADKIYVTWVSSLLARF